MRSIIRFTQEALGLRITVACNSYIKHQAFASDRIGLENNTTAVRKCLRVVQYRFMETRSFDMDSPEDSLTKSQFECEERRELDENSELSTCSTDLVGKAFSGRVEDSSWLGYRITAHVGEVELMGWVLDSTMQGSKPSADSMQNQVEASGTGDDAGPKQAETLVFTRRPRKYPVISSSRVVSNGAGRKTSKRPGYAPAVVPLAVAEIPRRKIVIIGAGIAGLAAARALVDRGFNVTILEGRKRIGGRIATDWSMGCPVDMGAAFIHGIFGNPLTEIARERQLRLFTPRDVDDLRHDNGEPISPLSDERAGNVWRAMLKRAAQIAKGELDGDPDIDISLGKLLHRLRQTVAVPLTAGDEMVLSWHMANLEMPCAANLDQLSAKHWDMDDASAFLGAHTLVRDGYSSIAHALSADLDIRYNCTVSRIEHDVPIVKSGSGFYGAGVIPGGSQSMFSSSDARSASEGLAHSWHNASRAATRPDEKGTDISLSNSRSSKSDNFAQHTSVDNSRQAFTKKSSGVRVETRCGQIFAAEACIVTVPLGVLQSGDVAFWPPLPYWKSSAMSRIGFGLLNKIVLRFEHPFWAFSEFSSGSLDRKFDERTADSLQSTDKDPGGPDYIGRVTSKHGEFYLFLSMLRCTGAPILVALTAGDFAEQLENMLDSEISEKAMEVLRGMFPKVAPAAPLAYAVTRWRSDPFSRGSYSFAKVGTTPSDYDLMARPVGSTLFFAGEATNRHHPATAHGAYMTGLREAGKIIKASDASIEEIRKHCAELRVMEDPHSKYRSDAHVIDASDRGGFFTPSFENGRFSGQQQMPSRPGKAANSALVQGGEMVEASLTRVRSLHCEHNNSSQSAIERALDLSYQHKVHPSKAERDQLAQQLGLPEIQIRKWFMAKRQSS